jgi:succinoglycan biosynthesis transport protein ExoP
MRDSAIYILKQDMEVERAGLSYAINITYTAGTPELAMRVANGFAEAYLDDQTDRQIETARRLSEWLRSRLDDLRAQGYDSSRRAEEQSAFRGTYDSFLQRYTEAVQQQSLPIAQAQVITAAVAPSSPSAPNAPLILAASVVLGVVLGVGRALAKDLLDRTIRTRKQLDHVTRAVCLGVLPRFRVPRGRAWLALPIGRRSKRLPSDNPQRHIVAAPQFSIAVNAPLSHFAETLRSVKVAADCVSPAPVNVLGVTSSLPKEGKTTVAANLARLVGQTTGGVLLIDADLRNPRLSRGLVPADTPGLIELVRGSIALADAVWMDPTADLHFLPVGGKRLSGSEILGSQSMHVLMNQLRAEYRFIVVDLPPVVPVVDVKAASHFIDAFAFVVEWGVATIDVVVDAIRESGIDGKIVGTVLNKVSASQLRKVDWHASSRATRSYFQPSRHTA